MQYIDLHCDWLSRACAEKEPVSLESATTMHVDLERLRAGACEAQVFAVFTDCARSENPLGEALRQIGRFQEALQTYPHWVAFAQNAAQIAENRRLGRISALLSLEDAGVVGTCVQALPALFALGVRMMSLTWNRKNALAAPNHVAQNQPDVTPALTDAGREAVALANHYGVLLDVSHLSDGCFYELLKETPLPVLASHSNARSICPHVRNLTDDMIYKIAVRGGVIGLNFYPPFLGGDGDLAMICAHARHIAKIGGAACLAIGSDYDGFTDPPAIPDPASMPLLADALQKSGFAASEVRGIFGENFRRLLREIAG